MLPKLNTHRFALAGLFVTALFSHNLFAEHALPEFTAKYGIQKFGIKLAEAIYQLSHTKTGYKFTQNTNLYGISSLFRDDSVSVISYVDEVDDQLLLKKHSYIQTGKNAKNNLLPFCIVGII